MKSCLCLCWEEELLGVFQRRAHCSCHFACLRCSKQRGNGSWIAFVCLPAACETKRLQIMAQSIDLQAAPRCVSWRLTAASKNAFCCFLSFGRVLWENKPTKGNPVRRKSDRFALPPHCWQDGRVKSFWCENIKRETPTPSAPAFASSNQQRGHLFDVCADSH